MKKNRGNVIVVSINKPQTENREENIQLLEKQLTGAVFDEKKTKFYFPDKVTTECKICFENKKS